MRRSPPEGKDGEDYVFVIRSLDAGGAERQLILLACALAGNGHGVRVITFYSGGAFEKEAAACGVELLSMNKKGRWDLLGFMFRLVKTVRDSRGRAAVGFLEGANILLIASKFLLPGKIIVNRLAATYMDLDRYDWLSSWSFRAEIRLARFADLVITNSVAGKTRAEQSGVAAGKVFVVPNAIDSNVFKADKTGGAALRKEWGVGRGGYVIGLVGRIDPMKDHPTFIRAAELVLERRSDVVFICVGSGSDKDYDARVRALARDLVNTGRMLFLGFRTDLPAIYTAMDVNVLSSYGEGSPNSVIESMSCQTTCVVTDVGDARLLVGDTGEVVPVRDCARLAQGILRQLDKLAGQPDLGTRAREKILADYSVQKTVASLQSALQSALAL
jgi:glycosyltransferase involved in cell wall biosynthesis